jgi:hypothetical protein
VLVLVGVWHALGHLREPGALMDWLERLWLDDTAKGRTEAGQALQDRSYGMPADPGLPSDREALFPPAVTGGPEVIMAALMEGMCPFGHSLVPVPVEQVHDSDHGAREGECHDCRPCTRWRWESTAGALWSRSRLHIMAIPEGHT